MQIINSTLVPHTFQPKTAVAQKPRVLGSDSVSFSGNGKKLSKSDLSGFDYLCNELFKFPLEKMSSQEDFDSAAKAETEKYFSAQYPCKREDAGETIEKARKEDLEKWHEYLTQKSPSCTKKPSVALIIAKNLVKNLKPSNEAIPPVLNENVLEATMAQLEKMLIANKTHTFNFMDTYNENLKAHYLKDATKEETEKGVWIKIPSKTKDEANFDENVKMLKVLSCPTWCTSSFGAAMYLPGGDFHIYMEDGKTKLGVRFEGNRVEEVQDPRNDLNITGEYLKIFEQYAARNDYEVKEDCCYQVGYDELAHIETERLKNKLAEPVKNKDYFTILDNLGFDPKVLESGKLEINGYNRFSYDCTMKDLGIDENELFKNIEIIRGDVDLGGTELESLGAVKEIHGDFNVKHDWEENSKLCNFGELTFVKGNLKLENHPIEDLGKIKTVEGHLDLTGSQIDRLRYLSKVGGNLILRNSKVKWLDHLREVGGNLDFVGSKFEETGKHKIKKKDGTVVTLPKFEKLEKVGGDIIISKYAYTDEMDEDLWRRNSLNLAKLV